MNYQQVPIRPTAVNYGLIAGGITTALGIIFNLAGIVNSETIAADPQSGRWTSWVSWLVMGAVIFMAMSKQREKEGGYLSYGRAFRTGFGVSLVCALVAIVATLLNLYVIDPGFTEALYNATVEQQMSSGQELPQEALDMMKMMMSPVAICIMAFIGSLIGGTILSALLGLVARKEPPVA